LNGNIPFQNENLSEFTAGISDDSQHFPHIPSFGPDNNGPSYESSHHGFGRGGSFFIPILYFHSNPRKETPRGLSDGVI
jgi:hypothetical protein